MKNSVAIISLTVFLFVCIPILYGQESSFSSPSPELSKNAFFGAIGTSGLIYLDISGYYERMVFINERIPFKTYWIRGGGGLFNWYFENTNEGESGTFGEIGVSALTGSAESHMELYLGGMILFNREDYRVESEDFERWQNGPFHDEGPEPKKKDYIRGWPSANIGYRYQKPGGHLILRTGTGFPKLYYLSIGICL